MLNSFSNTKFLIKEGADSVMSHSQFPRNSAFEPPNFELGWGAALFLLGFGCPFTNGIVKQYSKYEEQQHCKEQQIGGKVFDSNMLHTMMTVEYKIYLWGM
jgi:hypothetical protein